MEKGEIVLYQPDNSIELEVRIDEDTVWLNRQQMALLFNRDVKTIGKHVNNALAQELRDFPVVAKFVTTAGDGKVYQVDYYCLDMVLSVGYRVKSQRGIDFRRWANKVLKDYLLRGFAINQRLERLEQRMTQADNKIDFFVRTSLPPVEGIFFEGQIFDARVFASDLIKSAKNSIVLIDNYFLKTSQERFLQWFYSFLKLSHHEKTKTLPAGGSRCGRWFRARTVFRQPFHQILRRGA